MLMRRMLVLLAVAVAASGCSGSGEVAEPPTTTAAAGTTSLDTVETTTTTAPPSTTTSPATTTTAPPTTTAGTTGCDPMSAALPADWVHDARHDVVDLDNDGTDELLATGFGNYELYLDVLSFADCELTPVDQDDDLFDLSYAPTSNGCLGCYQTIHCEPLADGGYTLVETLVYPRDARGAADWTLDDLAVWREGSQEVEVIIERWQLIDGVLQTSAVTTETHMGYLPTLSHPISNDVSCDERSHMSLEWTEDGLGPVQIDMNPDEAIAELSSVLGPPTGDSGPDSGSWVYCSEGSVRHVRWGHLVLTISDFVQGVEAVANITFQPSYTDGTGFSFPVADPWPAVTWDADQLPIGYLDEFTVDGDDGPFLVSASTGYRCAE